MTLEYPEYISYISVKGTKQYLWVWILKISGWIDCGRWCCHSSLLRCPKFWAKPLGCNDRAMTPCHQAGCCGWYGCGMPVWLWPKKLLGYIQWSTLDWCFIHVWSKAISMTSMAHCTCFLCHTHQVNEPQPGPKWGGSSFSVDCLAGKSMFSSPLISLYLWDLRRFI